MPAASEEVTEPLKISVYGLPITKGVDEPEELASKQIVVPKSVKGSKEGTDLGGRCL